MIDTKALRQKVLDLAIRGKLVPQDPNDEPASVLLERIRAQKQQMVKEGKLKAKDIKDDTVIFKGEDNLHYEKFADGSVKCIEDEIPFDLPEGWEWCRIGFIGSWGAGATPNRTNPEYYNGNIPWLKTGDLNDGYITEIPESISELALKETSVRMNPQGSVLIAMYGATIGKLGILTFPATTNQACCACLPIDGIEKLFLFYFLLSQREAFVGRGVGGAQPNISKEKIVATLLPVPPNNEQKKIIEKIDIAFSFINVIDKNKADLTATISSVKSKILDLAIRGQLVPQDTNDEPASVLLDRIRAEKESLIKAGKIKRDKKESVIFKGEDNSYYVRTAENTESIEDWKIDTIPAGWEICCLGEVCDYGNCINVETDEIGESEWILDLEDIEKDTGRVIQKIRKKERDVNSTKHLFHEHQVLYSKLRPYLNKVVLSDDCGYCTSEILPLDFNEAILPEYARYYLMSPTFLAYADRCSYGVKMPRLGTPDGKKAVFLIPPYQEQKRIVEAIDGAFAQLDTLLSAIS